VPVLSSKREEARNLAAFHFCIEAGIKKQQSNTDIFRTIGTIEPLKKARYHASQIRLRAAELKKMTDYSSRDTDNLNSFLQSIGQEFSTRIAC